MELALWAVRGCLLLVFTRSVLGKVRSRAAFAEFTESVSALLPARLLPARPLSVPLPARLLSVPLPARPLAVAVVTAEAALVPALALPGVLAPPAALDAVPGTAAGTAAVLLVCGLALAAVLLAAFTALAVSAARGGNRVPCRCFGRTTTPLGAVHAVRNAVLLAVAVTGLVATALPGWSPGAGDPVAALTAVLAGAALGLLTTALDDLAALFRPLPRGPLPRSPTPRRSPPRRPLPRKEPAP
ncbi:MauE/DoxX family redox-associated membrane protein [Streptomyces yaizuensis]|uniref:Methylamine utilization protein MauE n=1 Tax=Streptomyces yaizuensis TaxID=2989713 RepID=A0ABQ5PAD5_9ACTN|nr:MauE/DoxX family redox-associated membrane protein [Streptomyces sp. YSPA8]GLF99549.1 methylamine utilization protein MauE [Streptomyces sp. YSPA8]